MLTNNRFRKRKKLYDRIFRHRKKIMSSYTECLLKNVLNADLFVHNTDEVADVKQVIQLKIHRRNQQVFSTQNGHL
jgi:hypothetical protein